MMIDNRDETLALQEAHTNIYNEIVKPDRIFVASQYFRRKWLPLLGSSLAWVIIVLRQHCYWSRETGDKRDWCLISQEELAKEAGISVATLKRLLKHDHADKFIIDLRNYFSPELTANFLTGKSDEELRRIREWLIYTRQAKGQKNPAGFLRFRLESDVFAPVLEKTT